MNSIKMVALVLIVAGVLGLVYGGFSYTKETHEAKVGPIELTVKDKETVNIPLWAGVGAIEIGSLLLLLGSQEELAKRVRQQAIALFPDHRVALAAHLFQLRPVECRDPTPGEMDDADFCSLPAAILRFRDKPVTREAQEHLWRPGLTVTHFPSKSASIISVPDHSG